MSFWMVPIVALALAAAWLIWRRWAHRCARCHSPMPADYGDPLCLVCRLDDEPVITALAPIEHACPDCGAEAVAAWYGGRCYRCHMTWQDAHPPASDAPDVARLLTYLDD